MYKFFKKLLAGLGLSVAAISAAFADTAATITGAFTGASANVQLAVGGVITLVAIVTGVSLIIGLLRK
jgi:hypothetical protein